MVSQMITTLASRCFSVLFLTILKEFHNIITFDHQYMPLFCWHAVVETEILDTLLVGLQYHTEVYKFRVYYSV